MYKRRFHGVALGLLILSALFNLQCAAQNANAPEGEQSSSADYNENKELALQQLKVPSEGVFQGCGRILSAKCWMTQSQAAGEHLSEEQARDQLSQLCPAHKFYLQHEQIYSTTVGNSVCTLIAVPRWGLICEHVT